MPRFETPEEEWRAYLEATHPAIIWGRRTFRLLPSPPRCKICMSPFRGPGGSLLRWLGRTRWEKNPNVCMSCIGRLTNHDVIGADVEISFMFADVRRSSDLARQMDTTAFAHLMQRFYATANEVLIENDAILDKFVGDQVVGFFIPLIAGPDHVAAAVRTAEQLLRATGHGDPEGPWVPLGAGVNSGTAFVGMVSRGDASEFTAFGDSINVAAHVAAQAGPGEILVTDAAAAAARLEIDGLERRHLSLKGHPTDAVVLPVASGSSAPIA
jgi:adenylate cyclase